MMGRFLRGDFYETWGSFLALAWGLWLLNPAYATFGNTPAWEPMMKMAPESVWGGVMAGLGLGRLTAIRGGWLPVRLMLAILASAFWMSFALVFFIHMRSGLTWITYGALSVGCLLTYFRLARAPERRPGGA